MQVHVSARKHGVEDDDIVHAYARPVAFVDLEPETDPPKVLIIGPDWSGNLIELIALVLDGDDLLVIHAMPLRSIFYRYLPDPTE